jgi:hypothetical protein
MLAGEGPLVKADRTRSTTKAHPEKVYQRRLAREGLPMKVQDEGPREDWRGKVSQRRLREGPPTKVLDEGPW